LQTTAFPFRHTHVGTSSGFLLGRLVHHKRRLSLLAEIARRRSPRSGETAPLEPQFLSALAACFLHDHFLRVIPS
jgi:hypothetical protein